MTTSPATNRTKQKAPIFTRLIRYTLLTLPLASSLAMAQTTPDANALFGWAERTYPSLFPAGANNQTFPPYTFRAYTGGHYLAVANSHVYLVGPLTGNQLQDFGPLSQYTCLVTPTATGCPGATDAVLTEVKALLQREDALWAGAVPTGAALVTHADSCYQNDGRNITELLTDVAADPQYGISEAFKINAQRINIEVLAVRNTTNSDGSSRREIDVKYDRKHSDGTTSKGIVNTLISGSSHGTCANPTNSSTLRFLGNQRLANVSISPRVAETHNFNITTGAATSQTVSRGFNFLIQDYRKQFTYAIVSGPGPSTTSDGQTYPFALKLLAPHVLREDPAMAGKRGHFTNWLDNDTFRTCRSATSTAPNAALADCVGAGAQGTSYSTTWNKSANPTGAAVADTAFANLGLGGEYTIALYNDDGWKTVNGHATKIPVATYTITQKTLPYTFVSLVSGSNSTGRMPYFDGLFGGAAYSAATFAALSQSPNGLEFVTNTFRLPSPPDGTVFVPRQHWHYYEGPLVTNSSTAYYPAYFPGNRYNNYTYVASSATMGFSRLIVGKDTSISHIGYMEIATQFTNRNGQSLYHLKTYNTP